MRSTLVLLAPLLVSAAPANHADFEKRQGLAGLATAFLGAPKSASVLKTLTPEIDPKATRQVKTWGPFRITASNATHAAPGFSTGIKLDPNSDAVFGMVESPCKDCTVLKATANLAYKDGKQADVGNGVYTHHIIMMQFGRAQLPNPVDLPGCAAGPAAGMMSMMGMGGGMGGSKPKGEAAGHGHMKRQLPNMMSLVPGMMSNMAVFVGGGGSGGSGGAFAVPESVSPARSGVYIAPKDSMVFTSEIINYEPVPKDIYLTLDFEFLPGKTKDLLNVGMGAISLNCSTFAFHPPEDKPVTYQGADYTMTENGYFVGFTPHLHDGGSNIKVWLNGKEICESRATYGSGEGAVELDGKKKWETITGYTPCENMAPFKKGDKLRMSSDYDLTKHILRPDSKDHDMEAEGMAMATFIWAKAA